MNSRWDDREASRYQGELGQRVYTSRLLGEEPSLVLHGGGNTSVKITETNLFGDEEEILYVKGSGWDLRTIEAQGFSPVRMQPLLRLVQLTELADTDMARELRKALTDPSAPSPSVEAILHAAIPFKYVDHTHADAVVTITNTPSGAERLHEIYGEEVVIVPYVKPGFLLAKLCFTEYITQIRNGTLGLILMNHGVFTFGETARASYERMIELVSRAETYLRDRSAWQLKLPEHLPPRKSVRLELATLRAEISRVAGRPMILQAHQNALALTFARRDDVARISQQGPATPDHVLRTKRVPLLGRDVEAYAVAYRRYFEEMASGTTRNLTMLDPAPRVIVDPILGVLTVGKDAAEAAITGDIYHHTMEIILRATALGGYQALPANDIFEVEYWDLEQAKLQRSGMPPLFSGEIALVTGAASGIGKACVTAFLSHGAAVVGLDVQPSVSTAFERLDYLGLPCDVSDEAQVEEALEQAVRAFGGLDMLVLNAGIFLGGRRIAELDISTWRRVMSVNLDANLELLRQAHPLLKLAPNGGRVVVIGSKNVPAPGPGAAAYSASKAALNQLARVAALEWASDGIRINTVHPNAVFDTALWTDEILKSRANHYGLTVEQYRRSNLLGVEVTSRHVAELVAAMCGPLFACTTGAQLPVDGGNERVI